MRLEVSAPGCPVSLRCVEGVEPWDVFEELRTRGKVLWDEGMRSWIVLDYATCRYIESDEDLFHNAYAKVNPQFEQIKGGPNITSMQGQEHLRMRRFHLQLLSRAAVEEYCKDFVAPITDFLIDRILRRGTADLTADFGDQLPPRLTAALFGMPWQDDDLVSDLLKHNDAVMTWIGLRATGDVESERKAKTASEQLNNLILPFIQRRRAEPGVDFVSRALAEGPNHYENMSDQDVIAMCRELLLAASDTTVHAIANAFYLILTHDEARAGLLDDADATAEAIIEETLRFYGSVQYQVRYAAQDLEIGGVPIRKDASIVLHHAAANRDPETYECPQEVDLSRRLPKKHLAFGVGPRTCPGAGLARAEMKVALQTVFTRLRNLRFDPSAQQPHFDGYYTRSWRPLNVVFG